MSIVPAALLQEEKKRLLDAQRTLEFQCKCGCAMFYVDVEIYADFSWAPVMSCVACKAICVPTEPLTNGPH